MFSFGSPGQKLTAIQTYSCSWYGSMLWNLYSESANKCYRSWNTTVRMAHQLPRQTRTYIVENYLTELPSVKQLIIRRYVKYIQCLLSSNNETIWNLANLAINTTRSVTGLNVTNIREEFGLDPVLVDRSEFFVEKREIPDNGMENIELLDYLLYLRNTETEEDIIAELNAVITDVCSS